VHYLALSPRMTPKEYGSYMKKGNVPAKQVMTVSSKGDIAHWTDPRPKFTRSGKDYAKGPAGSHVYIEGPDDPSFAPDINLGHGCMVDGLTNGRKFDVDIGGKFKSTKLTDTINECLLNK